MPQMHIRNACRAERKSQPLEKVGFEEERPGRDLNPQPLPYDRSARSNRAAGAKLVRLGQAGLEPAILHGARLEGGCVYRFRH